jgi:IPT/TIG domain-containing protein
MVAPVLDSLTPSSIDISAGTVQTVTIAGSLFEAGSQIYADGNPVATGTFVSDLEMTFDANTLLAPDAGTVQIEVRNGVDASNALPLTLTGTPALEDPNFIPDTPPEGASPNTEAERAEYMAPEPPDVYQQAVPVQFTEPTATGVPRPHQPTAEELPTTNAYDNGDGGLPSNPREPYPTGGGAPVTFQQIRGNG